MRVLGIGCLTLAFVAACAAGGGTQDKPTVLDVWPGKPPGQTAAPGPDKVTGDKPERRVTDVTRPTLSVFRPAQGKGNGAAVIIAPGGGYNLLAWDHEGEDVAAWLNTLGVTGVVLKYRVPQPKGQSRDAADFAPLQDAQRAVSLVRSKAKEWGLDPNRIGMLGFSAGGHLTARAATNFDKRGYAALDEADQVSCRPDFAVLVYPGGVVKGEQLTPGVRVGKDTPPTFFVHAGDDKVLAENSIVMHLALRKAGVPSELHVYATGGHGFGMRPGKLPVAEWPQRCADWLRTQGYLKVAAK